MLIRPSFESDGCVGTKLEYKSDEALDRLSRVGAATGLTGKRWRASNLDLRIFESFALLV